MDTETNKEGKKTPYLDFCEECYENIGRVLDDDLIKIDKITVLTGENATGKSLLRKLLWSSVEKQAGERIKIADSSMQRRTERHAEFSALGFLLNDDPQDATSYSSIHFIKGALKQSGRFIVLDEPEVGMSENVRLGLAAWLDRMLPEAMERNRGVLVITHSKDIVRNMRHDNFVNLQGLSEQEWLSREPEPEDIDELMKRADALRKFMNAKLH